ncbi:MAG: hypothetical protein ACREQO_02775 [Candidatus Binatia bacterium]
MIAAVGEVDRESDEQTDDQPQPVVHRRQRDECTNPRYCQEKMDDISQGHAAAYFVFREIKRTRTSAEKKTAIIVWLMTLNASSSCIGLGMFER